MKNEHNPIAQLITNIQQKWFEEITSFPNIKIVRLLINPDETKLYQGFFRVESSANGRLPELFVVFLNPFHSKETYSYEVITAWLEAYDKDQETFEKFRSAHGSFSWNAEYFKKRNTENVNADNLLIEMINSFYSALQLPDQKFVLALLPQTIDNIVGFGLWLNNILKKDKSDKIQFCVIDYIQEHYLDKLFNAENEFTSKSLLIKIDLDGAINKIIQSGDPNSPEVQLRQCMMKMSDAVKNKNLSKLNNWGNKCIDLMYAAKTKSFIATAYIIYAGMLFNFKNSAEIENLLHKGLKIAEAGGLSGDKACLPLIPQFYGYIAANYQLNKKNKEAIEWFCKQAEVYIKNTMPVQAINTYWQAAFLSRKYEPFKYGHILNHAYNAGENLSKEELEYSQYLNIGYDYYNFLSQNNKRNIGEEINRRFNFLYGEDWKINAQQKVKSLQTKFSPNSDPVYVAGK